METMDNVSDGLVKIKLKHNNIEYDVEVDAETYNLLNDDEDLRVKYANAIYKMKFPVTSSLVQVTDSRIEFQTDDNDYTQNIEYDSSCSKEDIGIKWNSESVNLLLTIRLSMANEFNSPFSKKRLLWDKVADKVNSLLPCPNKITGDLCDSKFRNLLGTYRANKRKQNTTGEAAIKWEFFEIIDQIIKNKPPSGSRKNKLVDTQETIGKIDISTAKSDIESDNESIPESLGSCIIMNEKKRKKVDELSVSRYLFLKLENDKKKLALESQRWQEKKELKLKKIDAINNLATAISTWVRVKGER